MTELSNRDEGSPLDLSALDIADDPERRAAVAQAVMAHISLGRRDGRVVDLVIAMRRRMAVAAAILVLLAGGMLLSGQDSSDATDLTGLIGDWALSNHTPTNGELLAAYKGYRQ